MPQETTIDNIIQNNKTIKTPKISRLNRILPPPVRPAMQKKVDQYLAAVKDFECDRVAMAKKSERIAWKVGAGGLVAAILAVGAVLVMLPLKTVKPYVIRVDNSTGFTDIVTPLAKGQHESYGLVLDKYFLTRYIEYRNGYSWQTIQNSYDAVKLMSTRPVFTQYNNEIRPGNKNSPINLLKDKEMIRIIVNGETPLSTQKGKDHMAQVRFTRAIKNTDGSQAAGYAASQWIATISYDYNAPVSRESERQINPLGFRVTSYREDLIK